MGNGADTVESIIGTEKQVEDYLNEIDYTMPLGYQPSAFAIGFVNFIKLVNGGKGEENKTPLVHYYMLDTMATGHTRVANLCHRGMAKTTVMGEYMFLYLAVYGELPIHGKINLAIYVSDSIENGVKNMRLNLQFRYEESDFLREYIPKVKFTDIRWEFINADGNNFIVKGYGAQTGVRGAKELGVRPQLAIMDDLLSDEDARSPTVIEKVEATVYNAVNFALHPDTNVVIWSGTPFNARDPLYKAVESGAWAVNVFPICEHFPCTREEFRGSWPDRFTYDYVLKQYEMAMKVGMVHSFNQELMLRIMSEEDRLISDGDIRWYNHASVVDNPERYNFYITTDFATSENEAADLSVISVWALNNVGHYLWADGICRRQTMEKNIDDLFRLSQRWKPQSVGIEVSGQQGGFIPWITREMGIRNIYFTLATENNKGAPGIRPNTNKMVRFNLMVPIIKAGRMFWPIEKKMEKPMLEAITELSLVSANGFKSKFDDFIDTISMLASIQIWLPSVESPRAEQNKDSGIWETEEQEYEDTMSSYIV